MSSPMRPRPRAVTAAAALVLLFGVAACGSSNEADSGDGTATVAADPALTAQLKELEARPTQIGVAAKLNKPVAAGKTLVYLNCGVPGCALQIEPLTAAAEAVGWKVKTINYGLTPETVQAGWAEAVRQKPDGIVTSGGFPTEIFKSQLAEAKAAGIPVISFGDANTSNPDGITGIVNGGVRYQTLGTRLADWIAVKSGGKAKVLYVTTSTFPTLNVSLGTYKTEIAKACPGCSTEVFDAPASSIGTDLGEKVAQKMQQNRDVDFIIAGYSDMAIGVPAALKAIGITPGKDVKILTQGSSEDTYQSIRSGEIAATLTLPVGELMWQSLDVILRSASGDDTAASQGAASYTYWFVDKSNVPSKADAEADVFSNVADYKAQFGALWASSS